MHDPFTTYQSSRKKDPEFNSSEARRGSKSPGPELTAPGLNAPSLLPLPILSADASPTTQI